MVDKKTQMWFRVVIPWRAVAALLLVFIALRVLMDHPTMGAVLIAGAVMVYFGIPKRPKS